MKLKKFSDLKLMEKFLLSYFLLIIIPLILLSSITYEKVSNILEKYITFSTKQAFEQSYSFLSYKLFRISDVSSIISNDSNLSSILQKDIEHYNINEQIKDMTFIRKQLMSFQNNVDINRVRLYVKNDFIYSDENVNIFGIKQAITSQWYSIFKENNKKNLWCPTSYLEDKDADNFKLLSVTSAIKNPNDFSENIGYVRVDFEKALVEDIMKKTNTVDGSLTYIQNSRGIIIAASDDKLIKEYGIQDLAVSKLFQNSNDLQPLTINQKLCLAATSLINDTDWTMVTVIPYDSIVIKIKTIRNEMILLMLVIGTIAYSFAYYFSNSLNRRISKLIKAMRNVHEGNLDTFLKNSSKDEIGELIENYNFMISRMAVLIEEQYKSGKEVKNAELKALQAQINPHFLYNTLDKINWMSFKNMNKEISLAVKSLANFYKLSLNKGKDTVSIKDEITHITLYVQIQNMRYSDRINLKVDINEKFYEYSILKITLQPIVENSILHGILGRGNVNGEILISAKFEKEDIILLVQDDGIGIHEEEVDKILFGDFISKKGSGYGLKNIDQRLKLCYGEKYGMSFKSQYGVGTTVEIRIPAVKLEINN